MLKTKYFPLFCTLIFALISNPASAQQIGGASDDAPTEVVTTDLKVGTGDEVKDGKRIYIHYTGWLYDASKPDHKGTQFESSLDTKTPLKVKVGMSEVIAGMEQGLIGMKVGGKRRIVIPSDYAYGSHSKPGIPPYSSLIYEVELLEIIAKK
ncbi:MAG: FKBP-type peptidyl-prolyl cis-trans isomerase [Nitrosomonadales bacterium]|nr:FKBP-type peptidyl-prolyl cis-trans isomerase [Nitrosomonadales bacterium]